ncbi:hypothetical protein LSAT2_010035 [Lamellibrachia satsuma]|nr:hypothetical protein LSAT2_010035 [Lamellibrachia satsuma]
MFTPAFWVRYWRPGVETERNGCQRLTDGRRTNATASQSDTSRPPPAGIDRRVCRRWPSRRPADTTTHTGPCREHVVARQSSSRPADRPGATIAHVFSANTRLLDGNATKWLTSARRAGLRSSVYP